MNFIQYFKLAKTCVNQKNNTLFKELRFASRLYFTNHQLPQQIDSFFSATPTRQFLIDQPDFKAQLFRQQVRSCFYMKSNHQDRWHFAKSHFTFLEATHSQKTIRDLYGRQPPAFTIIHKDATLTFTISHSQDLDCEGFLRLGMSLNTTELYKIAFWFSYLDGKTSLCIGALQGGQDTLEENRLFTKIFFGMRPQNMALNVLRVYAQTLDIKLLLTFPKEKMWRARKIAELTDINEFWHEQGGTPVRNTPFLRIDSKAARKDINDVASKKRSMYKQRYAFLDDLEGYFTSEMKNHLTSYHSTTTYKSSDELSKDVLTADSLPTHKHFIKSIKRLQQPGWAAVIALAAALCFFHST